MKQSDDNSSDFFLLVIILVLLFTTVYIIKWSFEGQNMDDSPVWIPG